MPNSNDIKKFPPESDLDLPDQQEFVPMEDAVTTAHLSKSWSQEVEEESLAQSGAQESATSPVQMEVGTFKIQTQDEPILAMLTGDRTLTIPQGAYAMLEVEPWPPLSREQVVELHEALVEFQLGATTAVMSQAAQDRYLVNNLSTTLERLNIGTPQPTEPRVDQDPLHARMTDEEVAAWQERQRRRLGGSPLLDERAPKPTVKRNCWTCRHNQGPRNDCVKVSSRFGREDVEAWLMGQPLSDPDVVEPNMPSRDADGCPGWSPKL